MAKWHYVVVAKDREIMAVFDDKYACAEYMTYNKNNGVLTYRNNDLLVAHDDNISFRKKYGIN